MRSGSNTASSERCDAIVIGAGIGGLVAAVELAAAKRNVVLVERAATPGGKLRQVQVGGYAIDAGPTVLTMRDVFASVFARAGYDIERELALEPIDLLARHAWPDGSTLDLFANSEHSAEAIGAFAGAAAAKRYRQFCRDARRAFELLDGPFMRAAAPTTLSLTRAHGARGMIDLARLNPFADLWSRLGRYFHDLRLRQLFARYATYTGSDPFRATATLILIAHVEQAGVWRIRGGMYRLAETLARIARELGVTFHYGCNVDSIECRNNAVCGVRLASGEHIAAPRVICNADARALTDGRLGDPVRAAVPADLIEQDALSGVTWAMRAPTSGFDLAHHNVFFGADYAREFADIFKHRRLPDDPTVYVCAQDRDGTGQHSVSGPESLLCLANAPPLSAGTQPPDLDLTAYRGRVLNRLTAAGLTLDSDPHKEIVTGPAEFAQLFPGSRGALYGQAAHGWRAVFERPGARSAMPGLYLAGGSVHPGAGLPMAALSGRHAARSVLDDDP